MATCIHELPLMPSVPVNSSGTKSSFPNSRFHNQHSTTPATCRGGNVVTNAHRQAGTLAARLPKSTASSVVVTRNVPQDSQSSQNVVSVCCQTVKRALVHFVSPFFRSRSSASAMASAGGLGNKPSTIMRRHRGARHCKCSIAIGREPNVLPHAGHSSSMTKTLAIAL